MVPALLVSGERSAFIPIGVDFPLLENQRFSFSALTVVFNSLASCCPRGFVPFPVLQDKISTVILGCRGYCARGAKANTSLPAWVMLPSLSYSNRTVPVRLVGTVDQVAGFVVSLAAF